MNKLISIVLIIVSIILMVKSQEHSHDFHSHHSHDDIEEKPSFKYSKEANIGHKSEDSSVPHSKQGSGGCPHSHGHSHSHSHQHKSDEKLMHSSKDVSSVWLSAMASTLLISLAPYIILFFIPVDNSPEYEPWLKVLLSFASGGLLGDAFLHLIPHALMAQNEGHSHDQSHSHSHSHSHSVMSDDINSDETHVHDLSVGLWVLAGIIVFLMVEKFVRIVNGGHGHSHSHSVNSDSEHEHKNTDEKKIISDTKTDSENDSEDKTEEETDNESNSDHKSSDDTKKSLNVRRISSESSGDTGN